MADVKITYPGYPGINAFGTKIEIDGHELQDVVDIDLHFGVDELPKCHVSLYPYAPLELSLPMDVHLHLHVPEGYQLVELTSKVDGGRQLQVVRVQEATP